ncbi:rhodanese-like domain-containing protein [Elongatibacter sediminis]|uniref:Rhodanese-like domain-containing protein n=1 Tax=Elongatibacter sediminis TaxID=3119006 RepID=A0AAW9R6C8_9GAMM
MDQLIEFITNHALLAGGFVAVLLLLVWTEFARRLSGTKELTPAQAVAWINDPDSAVIDVSPAADFNKGHIIGAKNLPLTRITQADAEVRKLAEKKLLVVCKAGQTAGQAASGFGKLGARNIAILKGGMARWLADQYPVTRK